MTAIVSPSEHDLLLVARALVGDVPRAAVHPILLRGHAMPARARAPAMRLLRETLGAGVARAVMRRGGARRAAILDGDRVVRGRTWERTPLPPLRFSALSFHLCRWLVVAPLGTPEKVPDLSALEPTLADEILLYLARDLLGPDLGPALARQDASARSLLARLGFPRDHEADVPLPSMRPWLEGGGAVVVAALAPDLARTWVALAGEAAVKGIPTPGAQEAVATAFLEACDAMGRRDLAGFVVDAAVTLMAPDPRAAAARLAPNESASSSLATRTAARRAAGAPIRAFLRVARWHEEHRLVRHFDDGYGAAQHLLARWEHAARLFPAAEGALRELEALDASVRAGAEGLAP